MVAVPPLHLKPVAIVADSVSAVAIIGTFIGYLPAFAALGALIWYCVQIWESKTVQHWYRARQQRKESAKRVLHKVIRQHEKANGHKTHHPVE